MNLQRFSLKITQNREEKTENVPKEQTQYANNLQIYRPSVDSLRGIQLRPGIKSLSGMRISQVIIFYELNFRLIGVMPCGGRMIDACAEMSQRTT